MDNEKCDYVLLMDYEYRTYADMDELLAENSVEEIEHNNWHIYALGDEMTVRTNTQWKTAMGGKWVDADE